MTATAPDPAADMLAELAEMDLSAAKHIHAQLLAATEASEVADLSRSYQRASRCVRQTLALRAKLAQEAVVHRIRTTPTPIPDWATRMQDHTRDIVVEKRIGELQDAMGRLIYSEASDALTQIELTDRLDIEVDDWLTEADFATADLDTQVLRACRALGLNEDLAGFWRDLPKPPLPGADLDWGDDDPGEDVADERPPAADTG